MGRPAPLLAGLCAAGLVLLTACSGSDAPAERTSPRRPSATTTTVERQTTTTRVAPDTPWCRVGAEYAAWRNRTAAAVNPQELASLRTAFGESSKWMFDLAAVAPDPALAQQIRLSGNVRFAIASDLVKATSDADARALLERVPAADRAVVDAGPSAAETRLTADCGITFSDGTATG